MVEGVVKMVAAIPINEKSDYGTSNTMDHTEVPVRLLPFANIAASGMIEFLPERTRE